MKVVFKLEYLFSQGREDASWAWMNSAKSRKRQLYSVIL